MTKPRTPQKRSKEKGYELEAAALRKLSYIFPGLRRTGSVNYKDAAPDLVQDGMGPPVLPLIVTRDARQEMLVTLSVDDLIALIQSERLDPPYIQVAVQCKYRQATWVGTLYRALKRAGR